MTVRTWITLSLVILVALTVAILVRLLAPVDAPPILARVGETRIEGSLVEACWPQRGGDLRCEEEDRRDVEVTAIRSEGELRLIVAYPAQPEDGSVEITGDEDRVLRKDWDDEIAYDLDRGSYTMVVHAVYPEGAFVRYRFGLRVR